MKNSFYNLIGAVLRLSSSVLIIPILIHILGLKEYGLWTFLSSIISIIGLADAGLSTATTVFLSKYLVTKNEEGISTVLIFTFTAILLLASIAVVALWLGRENVIEMLPNLNEIDKNIAIKTINIAGIVVWFRFMQQIPSGIIQGYQRYDVANFLAVSQTILTNFGLVIVVWLGGKTLDMMKWQAFSTLLIIFLYYSWSFRLTRDLKLSLKLNYQIIKEIVVYGGFTWLTALGGIIFSQCDRLIVGSLLGVEKLGVYASFTSIASQINGLSATPIQPLLPLLSRMKSDPKIDKFSIDNKIKQFLDINILVALGLGSTLFSLAPLGTKLLLSTEFNDEYILGFKIVLIIYTIYSLSATSFYILAAINKVKESMLIVLTSAVLSLILIYVGTRIGGLLGGLLGNGGYILTLTFFPLSMKYLEIKPSIWLRWLVIPTIYLLSVILINSFISTSIVDSKMLIMVTIQIVLVMWWFAKSQKIKFSDSLHSILKK